MDYPIIILPYGLSNHYTTIAIIQLFAYYYMGIAISQYKDPYEPISSMKCHWWVLNAAQMNSSKYPQTRQLVTSDFQG